MLSWGAKEAESAADGIKRKLKEHNLDTKSISGRIHVKGDVS